VKVTTKKRGRTGKAVRSEKNKPLRRERKVFGGKKKVIKGDQEKGKKG